MFRPVFRTARGISLLAALAAALTLAACGGGESGGSDAADNDAAMREDIPQGTRLVMSVSDEFLPITNRKQPPGLILSVDGEVRSGGWSDPQLVLKSKTPKNGRIVFFFVATPPDGPATQAIMPISAQGGVDPVPAGTSEVCIKAETNKVCKSLTP